MIPPENMPPNEKYGALFCFIGILMTFLILTAILLFMISCTISFQNISTHSTATDLVDENQTSDPNISPNVNIPIKPL